MIANLPDRVCRAVGPQSGARHALGVVRSVSTRTRGVLNDALPRFDGPVFPDTRGGWRDPTNVGKVFRAVRGGSSFEWVKTHTDRKTVATLLDRSGASARMIADQLGHSRVSTTQDVHLGRRPTNTGNLAALEAYDPGAGDERGGRGP